MQRKVYLETFGCQMNVLDSELVMGQLRAQGYKPVETRDDLGVIGCMAERDGTEIFKRFPHVDVLCGPGELDKLAGLVHNAVVTSASQGTSAFGLHRDRHVALMGANSRRSSTLRAAEDNLELLDLSRST